MNLLLKQTIMYLIRYTNVYHIYSFQLYWTLPLIVLDRSKTVCRGESVKHKEVLLKTVINLIFLLTLFYLSGLVSLSTPSRPYDQEDARL